ncbi:unnamed protein product, partial [Prunus brigantina]
MRLHRVEPSPPARHDKKSRQLGNRYVVGSQLACQGRGHDMPTQGKPRHAKLPIASLSRNALNGAMPSQGTTCQGKARHAMHAKAMPNARQGKPKATQAKATHAKAKPRPCRAKLPIASLSRNSLIGAMPLPRPRHAKARHANATQSKAMPTQGMPRRRHDMARQGKAKARPRQGKPKPRQAKANARQGK